MTEAPAPDPAAELDPTADVVQLCRDLIRIDTTNTGHPDDTVGEALAAEYVEAVLREAGYEPERFQTSAPDRQGVHLRIPGTDPDRPALLLHGHLDVVAAQAADWTVDPFAAEIIDGMIWGRGAVDMKDMDAMILAVVRAWGRSGYRPPRDIVVLFLPDEEAGGRHGGHWLVDNRPDFFRGATEAVGEVGGFSLTVRADLRLYFIQVAEKGIAWMRLRSAGRAGHGSLINDDNAVTALARAVADLGSHRFPLTPVATTEAFLAHLGDALGEEFDLGDPERILAHLGPLAPIVAATFRHTANPTMLAGGYKVNVIPGEAEAHIDGRFLPGGEQEFLAEVDRVIGPGIRREMLISDVALQTPFDGPLVAQMAAALTRADPAARAVPYMMSGGTDAKAFSRLGIRCFGFAPLLLPPDLNFSQLFHGVDERVPIDSLQFGVRVLDDFLRRC